MEEQGNNCRIILRDNAFYIVSNDGNYVWMWDKDGMWYSTDGIDGPYVYFDPMEKIAEAIAARYREDKDGRVFYG